MSRTPLEALKCPQCGGDVKLDENHEYGFCQYCGSKLQNTNFKIIKNIVEIEGNPTAENYMKLAERAYDYENYEEAIRYYSMVLEFEPDNWIAIYKKGISTSYTTKLNEFKMEVIPKSVATALSLAEGNEKYSEQIDQIKIDMAYDMLLSCFNAYNIASNNFLEEYCLNQYWYRLIQTLSVATYSATIVESIMDYSVETSKSNERRNELLSSIYKFIVDICVEIYKKRFYIASGKTYVVSNEERNKVINIYNTYTPKLKSLNPDYIISPLNVRYGCYIATCVYGSYDCREVWTLRRYRDYKLAESWYGRLFISIYYKVSPILVKYFGKYKWFKKIWKNKLDKMVSKLQDKGYEDTPYIDREWNK